MQPQIDLHTVEREPGTDARILSWNILSEELTPDAPAIDERIDGICEVILQYLPDAAGIQEISETAYALFADRIGEIYPFVNPKTKEGNYSFTGVTYNQKKYRLLESDIQNYSQGNRRIRIATWIYLEERATGRRFVLLSTHWDRHACNRPMQAEYMGNLVLSLERRFGVPVICTGDFNARENSGAFRIFMDISHHGEAKYLCAHPVNNCFTGHEVGSFAPQYEGEESIDHITVTSGVSVLHYETVINDETVRLSDHFPLYTDLKFGADSAPVMEE